MKRYPHLERKDLISKLYPDRDWFPTECVFKYGESLLQVFHKYNKDGSVMDMGIFEVPRFEIGESICPSPSTTWE